MDLFLPGDFLRKLCLTAVFITVGMLAHAQLNQRSELGFGLGTFNYTGDLVRTYDLAFSKPAATVFYRHNISKVVSLRTSITAGKVGASDKTAPLDLFAQKRNASF